MNRSLWSRGCIRRIFYCDRPCCYLITEVTSTLGSGFILLPYFRSPITRSDACSRHPRPGRLSRLPISTSSCSSIGRAFSVVLLAILRSMHVARMFAMFIASILQSMKIECLCTYSPRRTGEGVGLPTFDVGARLITVI